MIKKLGLSLVLGFSLQSHADIEFDQQFVAKLPRTLKQTNGEGGWSGGGGNVVVCFKSDYAAEAIAQVKDDGSIPDKLINDPKYIASVQMFDLFEAKLDRGIENPRPSTIIDIKDQESLANYISKIGTRFVGYVSKVEEIITEGKKLIPESNVRFYQGSVIQNRDIGDPGIIKRDQCVITTMAIQRSINNYYELYVDARLFNHPTHERLSKAIMLLHEYIYALARKDQAATDSQSTRKLVETAISKDDMVTISYVTQLLINLNFIKDLLNNHIYYTDMFSIAIPQFNILADRLRNQIYDYRPSHFDEWLEAYAQALEPYCNCKIDLNKFNSLEKIIDLHLESKGTFHRDAQGVAIYNRYYSELEILNFEMAQDIEAKNMSFFKMITNNLETLPHSNSNKQLAISMFTKIYQQWIREAGYFGDMSGNNFRYFYNNREYYKPYAVKSIWNDQFSEVHQINLTEVIP